MIDHQRAISEELQNAVSEITDLRAEVQHQRSLIESLIRNFSGIPEWVLESLAREEPEEQFGSNINSQQALAIVCARALLKENHKGQIEERSDTGSPLVRVSA